MNNSGTKVKVFYVKSRSTSHHNRPLCKNSNSNLSFLVKDLSTFQSQYLAKNRSHKKDVTHLSTLLQRDKVDCFQQCDQNSEQVKFHVSKSQAAQSKPFFPQDDFLAMFSNQKLNKNVNQRVLSTKNQTQYSRDENNHTLFNKVCHKFFNTSQQRFFNTTLQKKLAKPNNLSTMLRQKWSQDKLKKAQQKIQSALKTTLNFNSHIAELRQQARLKQKQFTKKTNNHSKSKEKSYHHIEIKQNFLNFLQERKRISSQQEQKVKDNKSEKLLIEGKVIYEPSQNDVPQAEKRQAKDHSLSKIKTSKKVKFFPFKASKLFDFEEQQKFHPNGRVFNKRFSQSKNYSNKMIKKKRKSIFLSRENEEQLWWSKQQIVHNSGYNFQLNKTLIF